MKPATLLTLRIPSFEAAIRKAADPVLARQPVIVVTSFKSLGRVIAACPVARVTGVVEEMHYQAAKERCPDAKFFVPDRELSGRAVEAVLRRAVRYSPQVELVGNGLVLLDTKGTERLWGDGVKVAELLCWDVSRQVRLPAAAGVAGARPWSLLASRVAGDSGVCLVKPGEEQTFLEHVPPEWVDGLNLAARTRLMELNIRSLGQLRQFSYEQLSRQFGARCAAILWNVLTPQDWDAVSSVDGRVLDRDNAGEVRVEAALTEASVDAEKLRLVVVDLASRIAATLRARNLGAAWLRLSLLHADGVLKTAQSRTGGYIQSDRRLSLTARQLLEKVFVRRVRATRLWLTADKLARPECQGVLDFSGKGGGEQADSAVEERQLLTAVDLIRKRFGEEAIGTLV